MGIFKMGYKETCHKNVKEITEEKILKKKTTDAEHQKKYHPSFWRQDRLTEDPCFLLF